MTKGQSLVERIEGFVSRYVAFPKGQRDQSLLLAIWILHTWLFERFTSTPYLTIGAATKQAGKTLCMEVMMMVCRGPEFFSTLRPLAIVRAVGMHGGDLATVFLDEAEKMSASGIGDLRSIMTSGYRAGGRHGTSSGKTMVAYSTYFPKCCALIGDVMDVVRDRSLPVWLERGKPSKDFYADLVAAQIEAERIKAEIGAVFQVCPARVTPDFLSGRDAEISVVLWSIVQGLGLTKDTVTRFSRVLVDACEAKKAPVRRFVDVGAEEAAAFGVYSERAVRDLRAIMQASPTDLFSATVVERMKGVDDGPWRSYRGVGLDVDTLARLVGLAGIKSSNVREVKGAGAAEATMRKGYRRRVVLEGGK